ncbi:ORF6N domain-containing protein [Candidatus Saganbacteria bacterium]|nr:ORF6N domain-containing protein [Candidatus Saganbacteria bacterium]
MRNLVLLEKIDSKIYLIRGQKVMFDYDLAFLYNIETKQLKRQVKRNIKRFPTDFMFQLTKQEILRCHFGTSSYGGRRHLPMVFTEQGIAMLSSVLNSERAIQVNIQIMRTFTKLRKMLFSNEKLKRKIEERESNYDHQFKVVFDAIKALMEMPAQKKEKIGFLR